MYSGKIIIGFIGLGNMGNPMTKRLIDAGFRIVVHDIRREAMREFHDKGIMCLNSPREVAQLANVVLASLPGPREVKEVVTGVNGLIHGEKMDTFIDLSTTGVKTAREVSKALREKGKEMLDAPVSGGVEGAKKGTLTIMVSGSKDIYLKYLPILSIIGKNIYYVSEKPGSAQAMKLINNMLSAMALVATSESIVLGLSEGIDINTMIDILNVSSGRNSATQDKFPKSIIPGTFDYGFKLGLMVKDLELYEEELKERLNPIISNHLLDIWKKAEEKYGANVDFTWIFKYVSESMKL
ncbi:MAG: NAD(P)-dependent oxidoreductase [Candidatus Methanomethylicia archaeon]